MQPAMRSSSIPRDDDVVVVVVSGLAVAAETACLDGGTPPGVGWGLFSAARGAPAVQLLIRSLSVLAMVIVTLRLLLGRSLP